jgi:nucleotide-binding universal stress UspA family protein
MYARILIATDGSDLAGRALDHGLKLAKALGSEVTILTVTEPPQVIGTGYASVAGTGFDPLPDFVEALKTTAEKVLEDAQAKAVAAGLTAKTVLVDNSYPAEGIVAAADTSGADLIVMGSHGRRGIGRLLLGSQANNVLAHTTIPVLVTR